MDPAIAKLIAETDAWRRDHVVKGRRIDALACVIRSVALQDAADASKETVARLEKERDAERKHVGRLMRDLQHNRERAEKAEAALAERPIR